MNEKEQAGLRSLLEAMHPADLADLRRYAEVIILSRRVNLQPPTAQEWERLTEFQKIRILWMVSAYGAITRAWRFVRSNIIRTP